MNGKARVSHGGSRERSAPARLRSHFHSQVERHRNEAEAHQQAGPEDGDQRTVEQAERCHLGRAREGDCRKERTGRRRNAGRSGCRPECQSPRYVARYHGEGLDGAAQGKPPPVAALLHQSQVTGRSCSAGYGASSPKLRW